MNLVPLQQLFYDTFNVFDHYHIYIVLGAFLLSVMVAGRILFDTLLEYPSWIISTFYVILTNAAGLASFALLHETITYQISSEIGVWILLFLAYLIPLAALTGLISYCMKMFYGNLVLAILLTTAIGLGCAYTAKTAIIKFYELETNIQDVAEQPYQELPR